MKKIIAFLEQPRTGKTIRNLFAFTLLLLVAVDLLSYKHPVFPFENLPGFYALFGFLSCLVIVVVSKLLGKYWLQRPEDYYDK